MSSILKILKPLLNLNGHLEAVLSERMTNFRDIGLMATALVCHIDWLITRLRYLTPLLAHLSYHSLVLSHIDMIWTTVHHIIPWEKNWPPWLLTVSPQRAHCELTVSSPWPKWSLPAVTEPWPGPWLSCDLAVTEPWSYWRCRDWAVTSPWLSCDLAVTELWPRRDWAVTSPSRDWAVIIGPGAVTTVVTVSSRWQFFSHGMALKLLARAYVIPWTHGVMITSLLHQDDVILT